MNSHGQGSQIQTTAAHAQADMGTAGNPYSWVDAMVDAMEAPERQTAEEPVGGQGEDRAALEEEAAATPTTETGAVAMPMRELEVQLPSSLPASLPATVVEPVVPNAGEDENIAEPQAPAPLETAAPHAEAADVYETPGSTPDKRLETAAEAAQDNQEALDYQVAMDNPRAPMMEQVGSAVSVVSDMTAAAFASAVSARTFASTTYDGIRAKGLMPWAADTAWTAHEIAHKAKGAAKACGAEAFEGAKAKSTEAMSFAREAAAEAAGKAKARASELATGAQGVVKDKSFQTAVASATGGAVALGVGGGAAGLATGTIVGTAIGLAPALFTFGLSIPVGAAIGGGAGLVAGATTGAAVGAVGSGAVGYGMYAKREQITSIAKQTCARVHDSSAYVRGLASTAADCITERANVVRTRLRGITSKA